MRNQLLHTAITAALEAGKAICEHAGFKLIDLETKEMMLYNRIELLNSWFIVKL